MKRAVLFAAAAATVLLSGCVATMGDLQRGAENMAKSAQAAVTPQEVMTYRAHVDAARPILDASLAAMKSAGIAPRVQAVKVTFRDSIGRVFESPMTVSLFRFAVPQEALDADEKELAPMLAALGARFVEWNSVEPIELVAIANDADEAEHLEMQLRKTAPSVKVTKQVGPAMTVGYAGVEMRMVNTSLNRQLAAATTTASAAK
jgi:hypothetical protein